MLCAGWVAGRGPLRARLGARTVPAPAARRLAARQPDRARREQRAAGRRRRRRTGGRARARRRLDRVPARASRARRRRRVRPARPGAADAAAEIATIATERNPLSVDPLFELAAIEQARGDAQGGAGRARAGGATSSRRTPRRGAGSGDLRLAALNDPKGALSAFQAAYYLDPHIPASTSDLLEASRARSGHYGRTARAIRPVRSSGRPPHGAHAHVGRSPRARASRASDVARVEAQVLARAGRSARRSA